ncbi:hypothetical protein EC991_008812 [Linnemannia zychae]|nr:hypothetical protein EC991_008812 [Linnemannia zychae]
MHSNLPSITTPAGTGAGTGAMGPSIDGKVVDWLQEAMQTVTMLESRLQELEEDCKAIPLYEQDRLEMVQVIQELDTMVQQDQEWIGHAETAIQWTSYVLENALISSNTKSQEPIATLRTRIRNFSEEEKNGDADASAVVPGLERNTRSEGMLPSLVPTQSDRTLELVSPPLEPAIGMGLGSGSGSGQCLLESNVNLSYPAPSHSSPSATLSAVGDGRNGSSDGKQMEQKWGSFVDETHIPSREEPLAGISESQEARYRSAIMVALRHLKNIDLAYPSRVSSSDDGSKTMSSKERGSNVADEQETKDKEGAKGNTRTRTKTRGAPPDRALKEWLDNSSMMSLASNVIKEDKEDQEEEESGRELLSVSCVLAAVEETGATRSTDEHMQSTMSERQSPSSRTHMRHRRHLLVGSLSPIDKDVSSFPVTVPNPDILPSSSSTSIETLNHALSTASINATISGSSQSLQTNLGHTLMDERVYLKQHIQYLDRLRNQELSRHQRIEQGHRQLIADLGRFSKELLGSVNELTCAQAAINEASELALLTLSTFEKGASVVDSGLEGGGVADVTATRQQQEQEPSEGVSTTNGTSTAISTKKTNVDANTVTRQKRLIAASRKELESSGGLAGECIKRIRHLAADCVGITELASQRQQPTINLTATNAAASSAGMTTGGTSGNGGGSALQRYAFANMAMSPSDSKAMVKEVGPTFRATATATTSITGTSAQVHPVQAGSIHVEESTLPSSSVFVDGIAFQEFEAHLASVRSSSMSEVGVISESTIFKRAFPSAPSSSSSSARLNSVNNKMNNRRSNTTQNSGPSAFMKKVLVEDIYPLISVSYRDSGYKNY